MYVLEQFKVDDLSYPDSKFTFILESPYHQEVKKGYPAAGNSGINMSKILFELDEPLGKLVASQGYLIPKLSLLNCSRIPLQRSCYGALELKRDFINFLEIQNMNDAPIHILKDKIKGKLRTKLGLQAIDSFRSRLIENITHCTNPKLIICGVIAQCFFEEATNLDCKFRKPTEVNWEGHDFNVFYEYHPSPKSRKWSNRSKMVGLLKFMC
ncbi:uracil-DNA glycosylase family protein [Shewanella mangrovisoli]|uniref:uracil-DNA glycosylase family protein n=1 Tax=Shewanella mangrovisoli TaxID=2864211 RepID=UPI0035B7D043